MIYRLQQNGFEVVECHVSLWKGLEDRQEVAGGGWMKPGFWVRIIYTYANLIWQYLSVGDYDIMIVGYPGQADVPLARLLSWLRQKPLVWDVYMSIYLIVLERGLDKRSPVSARLIRLVEKCALRLPELLIIDTPEYAAWFHGAYGVPQDKMRLLPLGADDRIFKPIQHIDRLDGKFHCLYYGTFIPNHGVQYIIEAARMLADDNTIQFELIGTGPCRAQIDQMVKDYGLTNVTLINWMDEETLTRKVASAEVCLGTFGKTPQSLMTMQNKIHEGLAMAKPVINGDSPVMRSTLKHGKQIYLCERENAKSLVDAIQTLKDQPRLRDEIALKGYEYYKNHLSINQTGMDLRKYLLELLKS
jgi:glycosyltransferase involved in cell wall biosynthesis